jgi:hypothetical protein
MKSTVCSTVVLGAVTSIVLLSPAEALANSITYTCGGAATIVTDGGALDPDGSVDDYIMIDFVCDDVVTGAGGTWSAEGTIEAIFDDITDDATTRIFDAIWYNTAGNVGGGNNTFRVVHEFPISFGPAADFAASGELVRLGSPTFSGNVFLNANAHTIFNNFFSSMTVLGAFAESANVGDPSPEWFSHAFLDIPYQTINRHVIDMSFYLDAPNDAFRSQNAVDEWLVITE